MIISIPTLDKYDKSKQLRDKIIYVLSVMKKTTPHAVAAEIMVLDEISTEDGVEDLSIDIENELERLNEEGTIIKLKEHRQSIRYILHSNK